VEDIWVVVPFEHCLQAAFLVWQSDDVQHRTSTAPGSTRYQFFSSQVLSLAGAAGCAGSPPPASAAPPTPGLICSMGALV